LNIDRGGGLYTWEKSRHFTTKTKKVNFEAFAFKEETIVVRPRRILKEIMLGEQYRKTDGEEKRVTLGSKGTCELQL